MSDDNKNLSDDLEDMIGEAKESAKKAGDKISQKASEISEDAKEFADDAKKAASEFADDAKEVLSDGKNIGIIAHITFIGWIIALVMNSSNKTEFGSFYIRQMLGFWLLMFLVWIPFLGWILGLVVMVAWIMSLISALNGQMKPSFLLGKQFQEWFKSL
ncbi:YtxH domain-containing protein [Winogradskyella endarachnes]|uniref:YtxH domain-containing protein n=1 Tax=Winogradskyella endarachnes TaxID=2681965 RepID=A0A6L6UCY9_9FLAO|nr:YtxH domain-containing protein [Winogradskyella endarachnes]MUU79396.1 YtxH domain-containing protein [Winogradskyella endarachnes]